MSLQGTGQLRPYAYPAATNIPNPSTTIIPIDDPSWAAPLSMQAMTFANLATMLADGTTITASGGKLTATGGGGGGAVSSVSNSDGTLTISPTTGAVVASLALGHANTWTAAITENQTIAATSTDGIVLSNTTAATLSVAQWSPRLHFIGQGWKTNTTAASQTCDWIVELQCPVGTTNPFNNLSFSSQVAGGGYVVQMVLSGNGSVELGNVITGSWQASTIGIAYGGTGQTTANAALNALLPSQTSASGLFLQSNGTSASWVSANGGVTSVSNSDGSLTISPTTGAVVAGINFSGSYTWYSQQTFSNTMLTIGIHATGAFNTTIATGGASTDGVSLISALAATSGAPQQYSPRLRFTGYGWKTNTTAGSQEVDFIIENQPQEGTTAPSGNLVFSSQINAGGYTPVFTLTSAGTITTGTWNGTTIAIANGGTGQTTANAALNALLPSQTSASGLFLQSNGTSASWVSANGGVTSVSNSDGTLTISPTTGAVVASLALGHANTWTGIQTHSTPAIATTSTDILIISNATAATSGVPVQQSGNLHFSGQAWNTTVTAATNSVDCRINLLPVSGATPSGNLQIGFSVNGGSYATCATFDSAGDLTLVGKLKSQTVTVTGLSASQAVFTDSSSDLVSNAITGTGNVVMSTSPTLVTPVLGTPSSGTLTSCTGLPLTTGVTGTLPVGNGGTGNTTFTAYSLICAGTTSTGTFQNVVGVGTSGQVLTSNGASALPTWQTGGGGAVSSVSNSDGTLTISPTTGAVVASLALGHANTWTGVQTFAPTAATGSPSNAIKLTTPAHTALTASTEYNTILVTAATQQFANGTLALNRFAVINAPTYAFVSGTQTLTAAVTLEISGCPTQGTSASFGGAAALRIPGAPFASANMGLVSLGNGPWNGSTSGYFFGSANGTVLAVNAASSYIGHLCNWQVAGSSKFSVDYSGNVAIGGIFSTAVTGSPSIIGSGLTFNGYTTQFTDGAVLQLDSSCTFGIFQGSSVGQQTAGGVTAGFSSNTSSNVAYNESTWTGNIGSTAYTISDVIAALKTYGWLTS